jgi:hypothetical protein
MVSGSSGPFNASSNLGLTSNWKMLNCQSEALLFSCAHPRSINMLNFMQLHRRTNKSSMGSALTISFQSIRWPNVHNPADTSKRSGSGFGRIHPARGSVTVYHVGDKTNGRIIARQNSLRAMRDKGWLLLTLNKKCRVFHPEMSISTPSSDRETQMLSGPDAYRAWIHM